MVDSVVRSLCGIASDRIARDLDLLKPSCRYFLPEPVCDAVLQSLRRQELLDDHALGAFNSHFGDSSAGFEPADREAENDMPALSLGSQQVGVAVAPDENAVLAPAASNATAADTRCSIRGFDLSRCQAITSSGIVKIASHPISYLDLSYCESIDGDLFFRVKPCAQTLTTLRLANCKSIEFEDFEGLALLPNLRELDLQSTFIGGDGLFYVPTGVQVLNLMDTEVSVGEIHLGLRHLTNLAAINLSDTAIEYTYDPGWSFFSSHPHLRHVDVSACLSLMQNNTGPAILQHREEFFADLCSNRELRWVNVSCLPLDGRCLRLLLELPHADFLGLFNTNVLEEELRTDIEIGASFTLEQLLTALRQLGTSSVRVVRELLRSLFDRLTPSAAAEPTVDIDADNGLTALVVTSLEHFDSDYGIQIVTTAALYYLTSDRIKGQVPAVRLHVLEVLLDLLERLSENQHSPVQVVKNCCLTLRNFHPEDELARYSCRVAISLLRAALIFDDRTIQTSAILMCCHNLASLHPHHKERIGSVGPQGGIELVLELIQRQHAELEPNVEEPLFSILELCWTFMWNITDETPSNVARFLDNDGLTILLQSLEKFPAVITLRRNAMGLVTNIAEVPLYRGSLVTERMMKELKSCLELENSNLEVTYNVAGTLCHVMAEGDAYWAAHELSYELRRALLDRIAEVVGNWCQATERWINYRSVKPIIGLLRPELETEIHLWASWALLSLCTVNPEKYCDMCRAEGALEAMKTLVLRADTSEAVRMQTQEAFERCTTFEAHREELAADALVPMELTESEE